jgi:hypothetical protein
MTREEIEECGWSLTKDYTHSGEGWVFQLSRDSSEDDELFWEMEYDPETDTMKIEKWEPGTEIGRHTPNVVLECKIHDKKELLQEMQWIEIPRKK